MDGGHRARATAWPAGWRTITVRPPRRTRRPFKELMAAWFDPPAPARWAVTVVARVEAALDAANAARQAARGPDRSDVADAMRRSPRSSAACSTTRHPDGTLARLLLVGPPRRCCSILASPRQYSSAHGGLDHESGSSCVPRVCAGPPGIRSSGPAVGGRYGAAVTSQGHSGVTPTLSSDCGTRGALELAMACSAARCRLPRPRHVSLVDAVAAPPRHGL
jgi:hypothetical protein